MKFRRNSQEFLETNSLNKFPQKIRKHGDKVLRISQEFPENISGEILRNFVGESSGEFLRNFSKLSPKTGIPQKSLILGTNSGEFLEKFLGILQRKSPRLENLGKFLTYVTWVIYILFSLHPKHPK